MTHRVTAAALTTWLITSFSIAGGIPSRTLSFDCGPVASQLKVGYLLLPPEAEYKSSAGYGWLKAPQSAFQERKTRTLDELTLDGVSSSGEISFRVDVVPGRYVVTATLGGADEQFRGMSVAVNDMLLEPHVTTPWFRLPYRSICRTVEVTDSILIVRILPDPRGIDVDYERRVSLQPVLFAPESARVALNGIDVRPVVASPPLSFPSELDPDTAIVADAVRGLRQDRKSESSLIAQQLRPLEYYLAACALYESGRWEHMRQSTGLSYFTRLWMAADLLDQVIADSACVLHDRALFLLGKLHFWLYREGHRPYSQQRAAECFAEIRPRHASHPLLQMYMGEQITHPFALPPVPTGAPAWAVEQREAMARLLEVIHWWVDHQIPNGEMGGGFGDDVEMLRNWYPAILGADDSLARVGFKRLADGVWNSGMLNHGYLAEVQDVEHSAEYVSDTQPAMILFNYGDPEYVERSLLCLRNFRDIWSGVNRMGHRHFLSSYIGADSVVRTPPFSVDHTMNARAMESGLWGVWYNRNTSGMKLLVEWGRAWVADAMRQDRGKPRGLLPPAVAFETDSIGGYGPSWYDPGLGWEYYLWESLNGATQMYDFLVGLYSLTGDTTFLKPLLLTTAIGSADNGNRGTKERGTAAWAGDLIRGGGSSRTEGSTRLASAILRARDQSGVEGFEAEFAWHQEPYAVYRRTGDISALERSCEQITEDLRYNFEMRTSEVKFTDRVEIPPIQVLYSMYTGSYGRGNEFPSAAVTWEKTGTNVSILVTESTDTSLAFLGYCFDSAKTVRARLWRMPEGSCEFILKSTSAGGRAGDTLLERKSWDLRERGDRLEFRVPAGATVAGRLRMIRRSPDAAFPRPDVALSGFKVEEGDATVVVHNIGNATARNALVRLMAGGKEIGRQLIPLLEAPNDLESKSILVRFDLKDQQGELSCIVTVDQREICRSNNLARQMVIN